MTNVTIALPDDLLEKLQELASRHQTTAEVLIKASIEDLVAAPDESFLAAVDRVLAKNRDLYERLA